LASKFFFDQNEVVADQIKNLFHREQRDGLPPGLRLGSGLDGRGNPRPGEAKKTPEILGSSGG
jgi:hypothetical protein